MENQTTKRPKADIDLEIKLPNKEKPFYNKLSTADNMIKQIKKAGSKLDEYQTLDVWINKNKNIVLSKTDILTDNLKEKILDRITLLGDLEKAEKSANSIGIEFGYKSDEKGIKTYNVSGNPLTTEKDFIIHVKHGELNHHKEQSDKWAMELSNRTDLSKGLTISQIDEKQAMHFSFYEQRAKELGVEVTPFIEKADISKEQDVVGKITFHATGEIMEYSSTKDYLDAIKEELDYNSPNSFTSETVLKEPELLKKVDDIYYGNAGIDNPNSLDFYKGGLNKNVEEKSTTEPQLFFYAEYYNSKNNASYDHTVNPTANYSEVKDMLSNMAKNAVGDVYLDVTVGSNGNEKEYRFQQDTLNQTLKEIEKLVINREINKGMEQNSTTEKQQQPNNVAENQNVKFLKDQIKYLGFGEDPKLLKELENKILSGEKAFDLKVDYDKASFQNKASFQLNFNRSESTGNYFLNTYKANLQNEKRNVNIDHTFAVKTNGFTAKQAVNLLEGRSVLATINNPKTKEEEKAFIKLKLDEAKNENGNFKLQVFNKNYGVDTAKIVESSKLKFDDAKHKDITIKSLERGNIVGVKFEQDKKVIEGKAVLNPQYKTLNLYDQNMKRVNTNKPVISEQQDMENNSKQTYKQSR